MSRVGKLPIPVPAGVKVHVSDGLVRVEGPKGKLERRVVPEVTVAVEAGTVVVKRTDDSRRGRSLHGLTQRLVGNMVAGVSKGFTRALEINGVGYRAEVRGKVVVLTLCYSHPINFWLPPGLCTKVSRPGMITPEGTDRELPRQAAAAQRGLWP